MGSTDKHTRGLGVLTKTCAQGNVFALQGTLVELILLNKNLKNELDVGN